MCEVIIMSVIHFSVVLWGSPFDSRVAVFLVSARCLSIPVRSSLECIY